MLTSFCGGRLPTNSVAVSAHLLGSLGKLVSSCREQSQCYKWVLKAENKKMSSMAMIIYLGNTSLEDIEERGAHSNVISTKLYFEWL